MKIDFTQTLKDFQGIPLPKSSSPDQPVGWTLQDAALTCLQVALPGDEGMSPMEKVQLGLIGKAIVDGKDITSEDAAKLKARICRVLSAPVVAWAVENAIEGDSNG